MKINVALMISFLWSGWASADVITLTDGSRIQGEVISMTNGQYQVQTDALGVISLPGSKIQSISKSAGSAAGESGQLEAMQSTLASDEGIMSMIMQLQSDPDMQAVLNDPEVMQAVQSLDFETLRTHPKMLKLMQNRKVQQIHDRVR